MADSTITFKYGSLIRTGPQLVYGGKWDSTLEDEVRNATTNADLIISINVFFQEINPAGTATGLYNDTDSGTVDPTTKAVAPKRRIQAWKRLRWLAGGRGMPACRAWP